MTAAELLETVTCTAPWTLDDSRALYTMLKNAAGSDALVDVHCPRGDRVIVTVTSPRGQVRKTYDVV